MASSSYDTDLTLRINLDTPEGTINEARAQPPFGSIRTSTTITSLPPTPPRTDPLVRSPSSSSSLAAALLPLDPYLLSRLSLNFDVDPPIPWPQVSTFTAHSEAGGRGWEAPFDLSRSPATQPELELWARVQYLEALCMPETIYPIAHLIPTLQRLNPPPPSPVASTGPSPLIPLLIPLIALSQKYRRHLPPLLSSLLNTSSSSPPPSLEEIDDREWRCLRTGLSIWMGSRPPPSTGSYPQRGRVEAGETEEQKVERVRVEMLKEEERQLTEAKKWLEGLERRETLLQIILLLLIPPTPSSSATDLPKKRPRKTLKPSASSSSVVADLPKAFDQLTDRLSVWQALGTLGVDGAEEEREKRANSAKAAKGKEKMLGGRLGQEVGLGGDEEGRGWVGRFCEEVVEKYFSVSNPTFTTAFHLKVLPAKPLPTSLQPPPVRPTSFRASSSSTSTTNPSANPSSTPIVWPPKPRTKVQARQLPVNANARDRDPSVILTSRTKSISSSRALFPGSSGTGSGLKRTNSLAPPPAGSSRSGGSVSAAAGRSGSVGPRAGSMGPGMETKTEKLMRRSVSFTKGGASAAATASAGGSASGSMLGGAGRRTSGGKIGGGGGLAAVGEGATSTSIGSLVAAAAAAASGPGRGRVKSSGGGLGNANPFAAKPRTMTTAAASLPPSKPAPNQTLPTHHLATTKTLVPSTPSKPKPSNVVLVPETPSAPTPALPAFLGETPPRRSGEPGSGYRLGGAGEGGRRLFGLSDQAGRTKSRDEEEMRELFVEGTDDEESDEDPLAMGLS